MGPVHLRVELGAPLLPGGLNQDLNYHVERGRTRDRVRIILEIRGFILEIEINIKKAVQIEIVLKIDMR